MNSETEQILQLIKSSRVGAFEWIVENYSEFIWKVCIQIVQKKEDAEDLVQEVFISVYDNLESFQGSAKITTWMHRIAVNKCYEFLRSQKRQKRSADTTVLDTNLESLIKDDFGIDPFSNLAEQEELQIVRKAIELLPDNQQLVYQLAKSEELSYQEIVELTGFSLSSVESLMFRAKSNLKKILLEYYQKHYK